MNGFIIATQHRPTPSRTQSTPTARRVPAPEGRAAPVRRPPVRPRGPVPHYRPNYWLVAAVTLVLALLAVAFVVTIAILWSLTGPLTTAIMVAIYAATMYALWRLGLSRL